MPVDLADLRWPSRWVLVAGGRAHAGHGGGRTGLCPRPGVLLQAEWLASTRERAGLIDNGPTYLAPDIRHSLFCRMEDVGDSHVYALTGMFKWLEITAQEPSGPLLPVVLIRVSSCGTWNPPKATIDPGIRV